MIPTSTVPERPCAPPVFIWGALTLAGATGQASGDDIGDQHVLDLHDLVLERTASAFSGGAGSAVGATGFLKRMNRLIQVAVFATQDLKPDAEHLFMAEFGGGVHGEANRFLPLRKGYRKAAPLREGFCGKSVGKVSVSALWRALQGLVPGPILGVRRCPSTGPRDRTVAYAKDCPMTKLSFGAHPYLLGFEQLERLVERTAKSGAEGYPPFNIEAVAENAYRITLAVAGFREEDMAITVEDRQLVVRGRQSEDAAKPGCSCTGASRPGRSSAASCWPMGSRSPGRRWNTVFCTSTCVGMCRKPWCRRSGSVGRMPRPKGRATRKGSRDEHAIQRVAAGL